MYAVIASGGKQARSPRASRSTSSCSMPSRAAEVSLTPVLLVDGDTVLATPDQLKGATVTAKVVGWAKGPKIDGFTYKRRTNQRRRYGHRQKYHVIEITSIKKG